MSNPYYDGKLDICLILLFSTVAIVTGCCFVIPCLIQLYFKKYLEKSPHTTIWSRLNCIKAGREVQSIKIIETNLKSYNVIKSANEIQHQPLLSITTV